MSKRRNHHKQAPKERTCFQDKAGKVIKVNFKRSVAPFRQLWEEEQEEQWDEIKLVHELRQWL
ncbi:hypothetical protein DEL14_005097 [Escherichia coli]|nr:hypothetical protein [Escherichia coli]